MLHINQRVVRFCRFLAQALFLVNSKTTQSLAFVLNVIHGVELNGTVLLMSKNLGVFPCNPLCNRCARNSVVNVALLELPRSKCLSGEICSTIYANAYQSTTNLAFCSTWSAWKEGKLLSSDRITPCFNWLQRLHEKFWVATSSELILFLLKRSISWHSGWASCCLFIGDWNSAHSIYYLKFYLSVVIVTPIL